MALQVPLKKSQQCIWLQKVSIHLFLMIGSVRSVVIQINNK